MHQLEWYIVKTINYTLPMTLLNLSLQFILKLSNF